MKQLTLLFLLVWGFALIMGIIPVFGYSLDIQTMINEAAPGDVISIPSGTYGVNLILKEGVILEGAGADQTILDGREKGPVVVGEAGSIIKGFTITNGIEGVKTAGSLMGVFENIITGNKGSGIRSGGGDCVIINNIISGNSGPAGIDIARSYVLAVNNTICGGQSGLLFWKSPGSMAVNNVISSSDIGVTRDEESAPDISNNIFWENGEDFIPTAPEGENLFVDPLLLTESGVCRLPEDPPSAEAGIPIDGLPEELTGGIGCRLAISLPLEIYRSMMEKVRGDALQGKPMVTYELLDIIGSFRVTTSFSQPDFTVTSSSQSTVIEEVEAYDSSSLDILIDELIADDPPAVNVRSWGGVEYPRQPDRYVMDSIFVKPEAYFFDDDGNLNFLRQTNFARIRIVIPEGYAVMSLSPEPADESEGDTGIISFKNPDHNLIDIALTLSPE
jgi:Periplasmic copper-binding protein (NosD)